MRFEWDPAKARSNLAKHDVSFELARRVWDDPLHVILPDRIEEGEQRWHAVGLVGGIAILVVVHAYPDATDETLVRIKLLVRARRRGMRDGDMKKALSKTERAQLAKLATLPDERIDIVDIPEAPTENWSRARRGEFYRPVKQPVTIRLDADVLSWFKENSQGGGYQTEINRVLRKHVMGKDRKRA